MWSSTPAPRFPEAQGVLVCGIGRNVARAWPQGQGQGYSVKQTLKAFPEFRLCFYENDSTDKTVEAWEAWRSTWHPARQGWLQWVSRTLGRRPAAEDIGEDQGPLGEYTERLAEYRNWYVDEVILNTAEYPLDRFPWVWILDLDLEYGWDTPALWRAWQQLPADWLFAAHHGVVPSQQRQSTAGQRRRSDQTNQVDRWISYDTLAFQDHRFPEWPHTLGEGRYWQATRIKRVKRYLTRHLETSDAPLPVQSAFGGLGLYRRAPWVQSRARYRGRTGEVAHCEHLALHRTLGETGQGQGYLLPHFAVRKGRHGYKQPGDDAADS